MFIHNFQYLAKDNTDFRRVLHTTTHSQIVAMNLQPGEDIGEEVHPATDQLFIIADGKGKIMVDDEKLPVTKKCLVVVPAGARHNLTNTGEKPLKFLTIYTPPAHPSGTIEAEKPQINAEEPDDYPA